ncbi:M24 family metallopeptidase [Cryptosporangium minutisporangium]|uniref:Xaa-Pro peptidase family protein n=1 Tax=Cryptosporangium minutisporangium TaxID=113569 RepID=A0ABP6T8C5_9ACTN
MSESLYPSDRLRVAQQATAEAGLDALLLTPGADLRYLTGYDAHALERLTCLVLPADGDPVLVVPALEEPAAKASPAGGLDLEIRAFPEGEDAYALIRGVLGGGPRRLGLADRMWAEQVLAFRATFPDADQVLAGKVLRPLRVRKSPAEVEALRRAGQAIDRVHARMGEWLVAGRTEAAVGRDIADAILAEGHAQVSFVIVGSGPNGASPHHAVSDRVIEEGDPVVVDIGGITAEGYCSDSTRTYVLGAPPEGFATAYAVLQEAQEAGVAAVRPGVTAASIDAACRDVLTAAGYGDAFIHRTGHGIGLEEHEEPWIIGGNQTVLEPGMAFSVEPGFYLAGRYGARIEDIVVCGEEGPDRLNDTPRTLTLL